MVLSALQNVKDNLSTINQLQAQADAFQQLYQRNQQLFGSQRRSCVLAPSVGRPAIAACEPTTLLLMQHNRTVGAGLLAKAA